MGARDALAHEGASALRWIIALAMLAICLHVSIEWTHLVTVIFLGASLALLLYVVSHRSSASSIAFLIILAITTVESRKPLINPMSIPISKYSIMAFASGAPFRASC